MNRVNEINMAVRDFNRITDDWSDSADHDDCSQCAYFNTGSPVCNDCVVTHDVVFCFEPKDKGE